MVKRKRSRLFGAILFSRFLVVTIASGLAGGSAALMLKAQDLGVLKMTVERNRLEIDIMQAKYEQLASEVATMRGIGMGLGAILVVLQVFQAMAARTYPTDRRRPDE